jgi:hypothetical protein
MDDWMERSDKTRAGMMAANAPWHDGDFLIRGHAVFERAHTHAGVDHYLAKPVAVFAGGGLSAVAEFVLENLSGFDSGVYILRWVALGRVDAENEKLGEPFPAQTRTEKGEI